MDQPGESPAARARLAWWVTAAFVAATVPRLLNHELWRDEAWLWLVAIDSRSLAELVGTLSRSGQGYLFPLLAHALAQLWESPRALQSLHLAIAAGGVLVFVRWAPFGRWSRVLFVFGFFAFYEYAVLSRHYALGALLLWLGCVAARRDALVVFGACVGLLCQTTVYGFILAIALASGWSAERQVTGKGWRLGWRGLVGALLAVAGGVAGVVQLVPRGGTSFAPGWLFGWDPQRAMEALAVPWRVAVPLPMPRVQFWNSNLLDPWPSLQALAGAATLVLAVAVLWPRRTALVTFLVGGSGLLLFSYVKYLGTMRHHGHWWLLAAAALWLAGGLPAGGRHRWRRPTIAVLLIAHGLAAIFASVIDLRHPFSNGPAVAELLRDIGLDRYPLLGWREPPAASVSLPLGVPLFAPSRGVYARYPDWGPTQRELDLHEVRCAARALAAGERSDIVLVVGRPLPPWGEQEPAGSRQGAIVASEDFHLYRMFHDRLEATAVAAACR